MIMILIMRISAYTGDPSGAIYMGEGVFLHTDVETSYGPVRGNAMADFTGIARNVVNWNGSLNLPFPIHGESPLMTGGKPFLRKLQGQL